MSGVVKLSSSGYVTTLDQREEKIGEACEENGMRVLETNKIGRYIVDLSFRKGEKWGFKKLNQKINIGTELNTR